MTNDQVQDAIAYNKKQGYHQEEIRLTQRTVGATEDGLWGPETVTKTAEWQSRSELTADGKVGPECWAAIKASWELVPTEPPPVPRVQVGTGLAAYDNRFPGHTPEEAMQKDLDTAINEGCTEVRYWSSEWLIDEKLPNGGGKGNTYSGPWLASQSPASDLIIGAWIDDPTSNVKSQGFVDRLVEMNISRGALMINRSNTREGDDPWKLRWKRKDLEVIAPLYESAGIELVGTCWPQPSKDQIDAMCADMAWILPLIGSKTFEVDTEGNWKKKFLQGFQNMTQASRYLAEQMRRLVGDDGELELTTYTYHTENSSSAILAPLMDRLLPQAYAVRHRGNETVDWDDRLGPGNHVSLAVDRARQAAIV